MKVLLLNGSPRKKGNTHILLEEMVKTFEEENVETELIQIGGKNIHGCRACNKCTKTLDEKCGFTDDYFSEIMEKTVIADALILGSPCYYTDVTAEMKAFIDRAGYIAFANKTTFQGKIGAAVIAAGRSGATHAYDTINHMFLMSKMIVPGSIYWNMGLAEEKGGIAKDHFALNNMQHLAKTIAWLGKAIKPHIAEYPE